MGIFSKKEKKELVLLFDIGSSSVGGALLHLGDNGVPEIILSVRDLIQIEKETDPERLLFLTLDALKSVASRICMSGMGAPSKIFCVLSSPWYASQTRTIRFTQDKPFVFTGEMADELIAKEIKVFESEHDALYPSNNNKVEIIELKNMQTKLNGYATPHPYKQKATELELTVFLSVSQVLVLEKIKSTIERHFRCPNIRFSSFAVASFVVARDTFVNQDNFLLVNIGGEVTDISMIKKEVLKDSISFPMGCNFIIRGIAEAVKSSLVEARSFVSLYKDGHMANNTAQKFEPIISQLRTEWLRGFQDFLSKLTSDVSIPSSVFITVDQDLADFFAATIKSEQFNQYILTESKFRVIFLGNQALHGVATLKDGVRRDSFLIIESIYINRFLR